MLTITEINSRGDILITTKDHQYKGYRHEEVVKGRPVTSRTKMYLIYYAGTHHCMGWKSPEEIRTLP